MSTVDVSGKKTEVNLITNGKPEEILSLAKKYADALGLNWTKIKKDLTKGNYNHLVKSFEENFKDHVRVSRVIK